MPTIEEILAAVNAAEAEAAPVEAPPAPPAPAPVRESVPEPVPVPTLHKSHLERIEKLEWQLWHAERESCMTSADRRLRDDRAACLRREIEVFRSGQYSARPGT